jgi:hypothetical protein
MPKFTDFLHGLQDDDRREDALDGIKRAARMLQPGEEMTVRRCKGGSDVLFVVTMVRPAKDGPNADAT